MKKCKTCGKLKNLDEYSKGNDADGLQTSCKSCEKERVKNYRHSKIGVTVGMYHHQKKNSKRRGHKIPNYTRKELTKWVFDQDIFHELYDNWVKSGYEREMIPSCDRIDDTKPYTFNNIRLMTWGENKAKGHYHSRIGLFSTGNPFKAIVKLTLSGEYIDEYISMREAARKNNINQSNIWHAIKRNGTCGGFRWGYKINQ